MTIALPEFLRVLLPNRQVMVIKLEAFVAGAVYGEMGAGAPLDALKAQAVASRTYAAARQRHPEVNADLCTTRHCQEYVRVDPIIAPEIFRAVSETWGIVATYGDRLIDAFFFDHCDGHTRSAEELLFPPVPYLQSVECRCGFAAREGHGVGLCQRGAIVMAYRGATFAKILQYYYHGIELCRAIGELNTIHPAPAEPSPPLQAHFTGIDAMPGQAIELNSATEPNPADLIDLPSVRTNDVSSEQLILPSWEPGSELHPMSVDTAPAVREPQPAESAWVEPTPIQEIAASEKTLSESGAFLQEPQSEVGAPPAEKPLMKSPPLSEPSIAQIPYGEPPAAFAAQSPVAFSFTGEPNEEAEQPELPAYVAQLNAAAALSAEQISASSPLAAQGEGTPIADSGTASSLSPAPQSSPGTAEPPAQEQVKSPSYHVDYLPGARMIAGCLACAGVTVSIQDPRGNLTRLSSGSADHYGEGGFELVLDEDGVYVVSVEDKEIEVEVFGETVFIHIP